MNDSFYIFQQWKVFAGNLHYTFLKSGFEVVEAPYVDQSLYGFRATYIRRYLLHYPINLYDGILTTIIHVMGIPFGQHSQKMVILTTPRNLNNEPISNTLKLRLQFDDKGKPSLFQTDQAQMNQQSNEVNLTTISENPFAKHVDQSNQDSISSQWMKWNSDISEQFAKILIDYVAHLIEIISPGLIELPTEMKVEILKKLSLSSIIKMSQVNNEFRTIIFHEGESLWKHLCFRDFNIKIINRLIHKSWMELYRDTYLMHQVEVCRKERALPGLPERPALPPAPLRLQIEWLPEVLVDPFYPLGGVFNHDNNNALALEFHPLRRANSLDSIS